MQNKIYKNVLLDNDSDIEDNNENVNWTIVSEEEESEKDSDEEEQNTEDFEEIININNNIKNISKKKAEQPEINIEVIKGKDNEKCVQVTINMELENKSKDIINLDFIINKEIFLKIAKQLK